MKKLLLVVFAFIFTFSSVSCGCKKEPIKLEDAQYGEGGVEYLSSYEKIRERIDSKSNFVFYMYGATCSGCHKFTPILTEYVEEVGINMYAIEVNDLLEANKSLAQTLEGTPAVAIMKDGELYTYISGYADDQADYFTSKENLKNWFETYVVFE